MLLLNQRRKKLEQIFLALRNKDYSGSKRLFQEIFYGVASGKNAEPGMAGSLLYHMAMVSKMETETRVLLQELEVEMPDTNSQLQKFYGDFVFDASTILDEHLLLNLGNMAAISGPSPSSTEKIALFTNLNQKTRIVSDMLKSQNIEVEDALESLFSEWSNCVAQMRLRQEYQTIKGLLTLSSLAQTFGIPRLSVAMQKVKENFGRETVSIALDVTLKVGMRREKLQSIMLSDHFINYTMSIDTLDGKMQFLNCPIYGGHKYIGERLGISDEVTSLFCRHFCFAHAKAMLETVLPFTFDLTQPELMATHGKCEYYLKLGYSPNATRIREVYPPHRLLESNQKMQFEMLSLLHKCNFKGT